MLARRVSLAKQNQMIISLKVLPKRNDHSPFKANCQRHLAPLHSWSIRWPAPVPLNFLNARLSTKFNGGTKLLKRVENIEKTFEYNRVDKTLSYLRSTCKNTCLLFKNHNPQHFQNKLSKTFETSFRKDTHRCIYSNTSHYNGCRNKGVYFKNIFKTHTYTHHFQAIKNQGKWSKNQVTKSPWITMDEKGANTFPFHNLPPEPTKHLKRFFLCFLTFPLG